MKTKKRKWSIKYKKSIHCKRPKDFLKNNIVNIDEFEIISDGLT